LSRQVNLTVKQQKLSVVLDSIALKAGFTFSYNSAQFPGDSLVNFKGQMEVETILDQLLQEKYDYKEIKDYVILRYAPHTFIIYTQPPILTGYGTLLSGQIKDAATGKMLENVSVYEKSSLLAVLSNKKGYFQIPLVDDNNAVTLTVSKQYYHDMIMTILPTIKVQTRSRFDSSDNYERRSGSTSAVNRSFLGKMFISTRQKIQSLNISDYFATRPYQFSVIPKWNSRGDMSGQVVSKFSLNLLAGYNGGVHGFEMGSIANLNRTEVEGAQMAGVMNIVGGNSSGFQAAGVANQVYQEGKGLQMAGIYNKVNRSFSGMQAAGMQNKIGGELKGLQVAGLMNSVRHLKGAQIAGVINKASTSSGFQLGLINLLDTASGYGIGLVNIARHKGFYQLSVFASESAVANIAFKSGREAFYTKLLFGIGQADIDFFYYGIGVGRLFPTTRKTKISLDAAVENYERGAADKVNILYKSSLEFHFPIASGLGFFIGPSVNIHYQKEDPLRPIHIPMKDYPTINRGHDVSGWVGVNAGFDLF
ncbi:MAG TPA: hypothetical protein VL053_08290, partial [Arachidicoccus sp.]|nr:hypothetical protein [Arachidicoccus sp.]